MALQPLHPALIAAHKIREEAKRLNLIADELEASVAAPGQDKREPVEWKWGKIKYEKGRKRDEDKIK